MHGCVCRALTWPWPCFLLLLALGCEQDAPAPSMETAPPPERPPCRFDAATAGTIRGRVAWQGDVPVVPTLQVYPNLLFGPPLDKRQVKDNPNAPVIDAASRGVGNAVVFLRHVDLEKARPWDHKPVRVELRAADLHVVQGDRASRVGFVRRGDAVTLVSKELYFHSLHAAGANFFTVTLPDAEHPFVRRLDKAGWVELTSAVGYFWMRGHLLVSDHPYLAPTDTQGRFVLHDVPPGRYQVACWAPSWIVDHHDRDPDSALIVRLHFRPPVVQEQQLVVAAHETANVDFTLSPTQFK